jgi:hypothetical protein
MFDIEGRDSNYMVGLGLDDSLSQFSTVSNQSELDVRMQSSGDAPPSKVFFAPSETEGSVIAWVASKYDSLSLGLGYVVADLHVVKVIVVILVSFGEKAEIHQLLTNDI